LRLVLRTRCDLGLEEVIGAARASGTQSRVPRRAALRTLQFIVYRRKEMCGQLDGLARWTVPSLAFGERTAGMMMVIDAARASGTQSRVPRRAALRTLQFIVYRRREMCGQLDGLSRWGVSSLAFGERAAGMMMVIDAARALCGRDARAPRRGGDA